MDYFHTPYALFQKSCPKSLDSLIPFKAESVDGLLANEPEVFTLVVKSGKGKTLKRSEWDSTCGYWNVNIPQIQKSDTETLSIELRKHRFGLPYPYSTKAMGTLTISEVEDARRASQKELRKSISGPRDGSNIAELALIFEIASKTDIPHLDTRATALPRSAEQILDNTQVIIEVLEALSGMLQAKRKLDQDVVNLVDTMNQVYGCATVRDDPLSNYEKFRVLFDAMIRQSTECFWFISNYISEGYLRNMINAPTKINEFKLAFQRLEKSFTDAQLRTTTATSVVIKDLVVALRKPVEDIDNKLELQGLESRGRLKPLNPCLPGTRRFTISKIIEWMTSGKESMLWLSGVAGSGKSAVMSSLSDFLIKMGCSSRLAAYIRFDRMDSNSPVEFVRSLASQLARFDRRLGVDIANVVKDRSQVDLLTKLSDQLESLVIQPLQEHKSQMEAEGPVIVMIDGLDECMEGPGGSDAFLDLLKLLANSKTFASFPFLRFIVASRPEEPIRVAFTGPEQNHILRFVLDTSSKETKSDILHYLHVKLEEIFRVDPEFRALCQERDALNILATHSSGLFIWAVTIFRFLRRFPSGRLDQVLQLSVPKDSLDALNKLYSTVLNTVAAERGDRDVKAYMTPILGIIIAFGKISNAGLEEFHPSLLTSSVLCGLLKQLGYEVDGIPTSLSRFGSVIEGVESPQSNLALLHKSFDDFLTDEERAGEWFVDVKGYWSPKLAESCVAIVHSNVFSDKPDYSELSLFTHVHWTHAVSQKLDRSNPFPPSKLSTMFLDILHRGLLRWIYICTNRRHWGTMQMEDICSPMTTVFGWITLYDGTAETAEIVQELIQVYGPKDWRFPLRGKLCHHLELLFLSMLLGKMTELSKCYMSTFSQIPVTSPQRNNFQAILTAIREISHSELADHMDLFKVVPPRKDTTDFEPFNGVPNNEMLSTMLGELVEKAVKRDE
ncbi:hypothetical protein V5O48_016221 [Marasmius crinis-equi]|uniref:Nephrocystin 3-like N-terminal domain-containing protein n=1 Tax=Marasmius crinis-equi TaxID=585013 RepID=A0ABR3ESC8_9AGAR